VPLSVNVPIEGFSPPISLKVPLLVSAPVTFKDWPLRSSVVSLVRLADFSAPPNANVSGSNGAVGGLVGLNGSSANISDSYSTGRVSGISGVGGLVGENFRGYISNSNSSANVSGSGQAIGGLVGGSSGTITTTDSCNTEGISDRTIITSRQPTCTKTSYTSYTM